MKFNDEIILKWNEKWALLIKIQTYWLFFVDIRSIDRGNKSEELFVWLIKIITNFLLLFKQMRSFNDENEIEL